MLYLLIGYMYLFIHRPFEVWPWLGPYRIERVYMAFCLFYWTFLQGEKSQVRNRLQYAFGLFWVAFLLAWLASPSNTSLQQQVTENYLKVAVFFVLVITTVGDEATLKRLIVGYLVVVGFYMTHSLREYANGRMVYRMGVSRMVGVDVSNCDPNTFAATLLYSLPLSIPFWSECSTWKHKLLLLYYTALTILCVLLTGSRSGFIVLSALGAIVLPKFRRKWVVLPIVVTAIPLIWITLPSELQVRFRTIVDPSAGPKNAQESAEGRTQGLLDGIKLWERSPFVGFGPGSFAFAVGHGFEAHNLYGQALGELGGFGALALAGVVFGFFANSLEARKLGRSSQSCRGSFPERVCLVVSMAVILMLIKGFADHNLYRYTWLWFGAFQAIALCSLKTRIDQERQSVRNSQSDGDEFVDDLTGAVRSGNDHGYGSLDRGDSPPLGGDSA